MSGLTFNEITFDQFKQEASTFFRATDDRSAVTIEQVEAGTKALSLLYVGRTDDWTEIQLHQATMIMEMAVRREIEVVIANENKKVAELVGCES